jgi:hypothetical protein
MINIMFVLIDHSIVLIIYKCLVLIDHRDLLELKDFQ